MKALRRITSKLANLLLVALFLASVPVALASNTWYVDGVNGNDNNGCKSPQSACKTIGHAISLASSGDSVMVAPSIYIENLTINVGLKIIGSDPRTAIVDGGGNGTVVTIPSTTAHVTLSKLTIRNGKSQQYGGGIYSGGALTLNDSIVTANSASGAGGGIACSLWETLTVNRSTISANSSSDGGGVAIFQCTARINNSTISGNSVTGGFGGGVYVYDATARINNSTVSGNISQKGSGGGIFLNGSPGVTQNTIVAKNSGGNCRGSAVTSHGYNLSSDKTCRFNGPGDMNNTKAKLGKLGYHGGPTQTIPELPGSPTIDAGNPNGCKHGNGHLLTTDQRSYARPGKHKSDQRCDIGAFETQTD